MGDGFVKHDDGKPDVSLVPPRALLAVARVLTHALKKYPRDNWRKNVEKHRLVAAIGRHLLAYMAGEKTDPDSGEHHLAHAACTAMFLVELDAVVEPPRTCSQAWFVGGKPDCVLRHPSLESGMHKCTGKPCHDGNHVCSCGLPR